MRTVTNQFGTFPIATSEEERRLRRNAVQRNRRRVTGWRPDNGRQCEIEGCTGKDFSRGWCQKHYTRWLRHGDPTFSLIAHDLTPIQRFFRDIEIIEGCWIWHGTPGRSGYGFFTPGGSPHRFAYQHFIGPIPEGFQVDHTCHNLDLSCRGLGTKCPHRKCANPDHLDAVTASVNIRRAIGEPTHCRHGHELTPENTRIRSYRRTRECRICIKEWGRRSDAKKRAA